ncbi:MAG: hypothetical protein IPM82_11920 [Saprospiraceae bacterium]|nr:hypothetical protein [Saprospiraceae bacterium]
MELPLVMDSKNPGKYTPLKDRSPGLAQVPEISERTLDFIYYVNVKDHSHAISSLIRVFTHLDLGIEEQTADVDPKLAKKLAKAGQKERRKLEGSLKKLEEGGVTEAERVDYAKLKLKIDSLAAGDTRQDGHNLSQKYGDFIAGLIDAKKEEGRGITQTNR